MKSPDHSRQYSYGSPPGLHEHFFSRWRISDPRLRTGRRRILRHIGTRGARRALWLSLPLLLLAPWFPLPETWRLHTAPATDPAPLSLGFIALLVISLTGSLAARFTVGRTWPKIWDRISGHPALVETYLSLASRPPSSQRISSSEPLSTPSSRSAPISSSENEWREDLATRIRLLTLPTPAELDAEIPRPQMMPLLLGLALCMTTWGFLGSPSSISAPSVGAFPSRAVGTSEPLSSSSPEQGQPGTESPLPPNAQNPWDRLLSGEVSESEFLELISTLKPEEAQALLSSALSRLQPDEQQLKTLISQLEALDTDLRFTVPLPDPGEDTGSGVVGPAERIPAQVRNEDLADGGFDPSSGDTILASSPENTDSTESEIDRLQLSGTLVETAESIHDSTDFRTDGETEPRSRSMKLTPRWQAVIDRYKELRSERKKSDERR